MYVRYGSYRHEPGEVEIAIAREGVLTEAQTAYAVRERWELTGLLVGDSQGDIDAKVRRLKNAYSIHGKDITLVMDNGAPSQLRMVSSNAVGGVRVVRPPSFPSNRGGVYATHIPYTISLEAVFGSTNPVTNIVSFRETLVTEGGGPRIGYLEPLTGPPIAQILKRHTVYRAVQQGSAVGAGAYPAVPAPIFPASMIGNPRVEYGSPDRIGDASWNYPISWTYEFQSGGALYGRPHVWGTF